MQFWVESNLTKKIKKCVALQGYHRSMFANKRLPFRCEDADLGKTELPLYKLLLYLIGHLGIVNVYLY